MNAALHLKNIVNNISKANTWKFEATVHVKTQDFVLLSSLQRKQKSSSSELCEILQLQSVTMIEDNTLTEKSKVELKKIEGTLCERCRRYIQTKNGLCMRCEKLISKSKS